MYLGNLSQNIYPSLAHLLVTRFSLSLSLFPIPFFSQPVLWKGPLFSSPLTSSRPRVLSLSATRMGPPFTSPPDPFGLPPLASRIPHSILLSPSPSALVRAFLGLLFYPPPFSSSLLIQPKVPEPAGPRGIQGARSTSQLGLDRASFRLVRSLARSFAGWLAGWLACLLQLALASMRDYIARVNASPKSASPMRFVRWL